MELAKKEIAIALFAQALTENMELARVEFNLSPESPGKKMYWERAEQILNLTYPSGKPLLAVLSENQDLPPNPYASVDELCALFGQDREYDTIEKYKKLIINAGFRRVEE
jgi:hypothetical protein